MSHEDDDAGMGEQVERNASEVLERVGPVTAMSLVAEILRQIAEADDWPRMLEPREIPVFKEAAAAGSDAITAVFRKHTRRGD